MDGICNFSLHAHSSMLHACQSDHEVLLMLYFPALLPNPAFQQLLPPSSATSFSRAALQ